MSNVRKPPRFLEEQREKEQRQKREAGKKSATVRRRLAEGRFCIVALTYERLDPKYKHHPYSNDTMDVLREKYIKAVDTRNVWHKLAENWPPGPDVQPRPPRTPPTEDELKAFALDVESVSQLPEDAREHELREIFDHFQSNTTPVPISPISDELTSLVNATELSKSVAFAIAEAKLSESDRQALQKISRETLRKCLKQLGVKGGRRTRRSG